MEKTTLKQQLTTTLSSAHRFKRVINYESNWHIFAQFVFWIAFVVFLVLISTYVGLVFDLFFASSGAAKFRVLGQMAHNIWLVLRYPTYLGWVGYGVIAGEIALIYSVIWRIWRSVRVNHLYQQFKADPNGLQIWRATPLNLTHNLIYTIDSGDRPFSSLLNQLSKEKQAEWEAMSHQSQLMRWQAPRTSYDEQKMIRFIKANFPTDYHFVDVMMSEPYSLPLYWKKDAKEQWAAGMTNQKHRYYFQNIYDAKGTKRHLSLGGKITNMIFVLLWH